MEDKVSTTLLDTSKEDKDNQPTQTISQISMEEIQHLSLRANKVMHQQHSQAATATHRTTDLQETQVLTLV